MVEIGMVHSINGSLAKVLIQRHAACGDCGACHVGKDRLTMETEAINSVNASVGDKVEVEMKFTNVFAASFIMYGIPLITFLVGSLIGYYLSYVLLFHIENYLLSFIMGIIMMIITFIIIKTYDKNGKFDNKFVPYISRIIEKNE